LFKNEFKKDNNYNTIGGKSKEKDKNIKELLTDERLSEFNEKLNGKAEFLDKNSIKSFYRKHLKGEKEYLRNNKIPKKQDDLIKNSILNTNADCYNNDKEVVEKLEKLKDILKIEEGKKIMDNKKYKKTQSFLYENIRGNNNNQSNNNDINFNNSNITNLINLNESKVNNLNISYYNQNDQFDNNINTIINNEKVNKLFNNLSTLKFNKEDFNFYSINNNNNYNSFKENKREKNKTLTELQYDLELGFIKNKK
jgi:hypothetical protein